jgi:hypothetical protein
MMEQWNGGLPWCDMLVCLVVQDRIVKSYSCK